MRKKIRKKRTKATQVVQNTPSRLDTPLLVTISLVVFSTIVFGSLWLRTIRITNENKQIQNQIALWETVVQQNPTYRDGYLKLATLYFRLHEDDKARSALQTAQMIDPNYEQTGKLKQELGY